MEAQRKQVTILFTDMVGFTSFSERSGEEAAFILMRSLSKLMDEAVREQGGVVQGFTGDGIMASSARRSRLKTHHCEHLARRCRSWSGSRPPDLISKLNTVCSRNCASALTREPR
jgi:class 3 adenylate cyclase